MTIGNPGNYKQVWSNLSETYDDAVEHVIGKVEEEYILLTAEATKNWLMATVGLRPEDTILEIGCGIGRAGQILAPICKEWIGCDVSPHMLEHAQERLKGFNNVRLVEISGFDLNPIADASVDIVYCTVVFMHLNEWDRYNYILEAGRVLKPGGRIYVDNFNLATEGGWGVFDGLRRHYHPTKRPLHISRCSTEQEIETYLCRAGFENIQVDTVDIWVRGYAHKPQDGSMDAILKRDWVTLAPPAAPEPHDTHEQPLRRSITQLEDRVKLSDTQTQALRHTVTQLEDRIRIKDEHILRLERLLRQVEAGRIMRLLGWLKRS